MTVEQLDPASRAALARHVARLKHDLGKYIAFQSRWLGPEASHSDREEALRADLLATRRGPTEVVDAVELWGRLRPPLVGEAALPEGPVADLGADPDVQALERAMGVVGDAVSALQAGSLEPSALKDAFDAAQEVADRCRSLWRRARR